MWIPFFSQTGSEIVRLAKELNTKPEFIVTNNLETDIKYHPGIRELDVLIVSGRHDMLMNYFRHIQPQRKVLTLHGYLRIIPPDICTKFEIYNGHPGAIDLYPELKGKDPQVRAWEGQYPVVGSVLHRVTPGVDEGPILVKEHATNPSGNLEDLFGILAETSLKCWIKFMKERLDANWNQRGAVGW